MKRACWMILLQCFVLVSPEIFSQGTKSLTLLSPENDFTYVRDTVYTLMPYYVEVNLSTQKGYLYSRTEPVKEFGLSSGTDNLKDGINTKPGLFVIQAKMEKWYSRQFDSTLMLNWMGFNWGIGFHSLQGNSYYKYLGKRKSSHGCVRLTREIAQELYEKIEEGTPVLVHEGHSAVNVAFGNPKDSFTYLNFVNLRYQLNKEYNEMYAGKYFVSYNPKLLIDFNNVYQEGLPVGDSRQIMRNQITIPVSDYITSSTPLPRGLVAFYNPFQNYDLTFNLKYVRVQ
jgi:hypothetical protein